MSHLVTIFGGSGFVGRYIAQAMAREGWRVRVAVRRPNEALFVRTYGAVGQVEPVLCNIRDDASVRAALDGADAVVNCVGILAELGKQKFDAVQADGAGRVARLATEAGVTRLVQISAIGADAGSRSAYARSKAAGEAAVQAAFPGAVILRPSVVFGPEDQFFNRFASMAKTAPVLPLVGARTKFQPVYVGDVAKAAVKGVLGQAGPGVYELGGPDVLSFRELMQAMLEVIDRRLPILALPRPIGWLMAFGFDMVQTLSLGIIPNTMLTRDQVRNLSRDNVVTGTTMTFADLGITPTAMDVIVPQYLWAYRPSGQFAEIKASARNLKG